MDDPKLLIDGLAFPESPRWRDGRLWVSDWGAHEVIAASLDGSSEVVARVQSFPLCIDHLPDGRLLLVSAQDGLVLRMEAGGSLATHADLSRLASHPWNDIVVDGRGNAYVNNIGFDFPGGDFAPGIIALVLPDGSARSVAGGVAFPNGMAITPDNATLIVAESYASRLTAFDVMDDGRLSNRRLWAEVPGSAPDGICLDADGAVWYGDVPNRRCARVAAGGEILDSIDLDRGCFACALGGDDGRTLFMVTNEWSGTAGMAPGARAGQVLTVRAPAASATSGGGGAARGRARPA
jgi:sugar lactone lactonase YvrE